MDKRILVVLLICILMLNGCAGVKFAAKRAKQQQEQEEEEAYDIEMRTRYISAHLNTVQEETSPEVCYNPNARRQDGCLLAVAKANKDASVCEEIGHTDTRIMCYALVSNSNIKCNEILNSELRTLCNQQFS